MRFGIDIDGVIRNFDKAFARAMQLAPAPLSYTMMAAIQRPSKYYSEKGDLAGEVNNRWFWNQAASIYRSFEKAPAYDDELEYLARLPGEVFLITSQPAHLKDQTYAWLSRNHVAVDGVLQVSRPEEKLEFINCLGVDHFCDDRGETLQGLVGKTKAKLWLFDRPWNRGVVAVSQHQITRIKSLKELL